MSVDALTDNRAMNLQKSLIAIVFCSTATLLVGCFRQNAVLEPTAPTYKEAMTAFYGGTLALQVSDQNRPEAFLRKAVELMPGEPAAWANLAVHLMRTNKPDEAAAALKKARELAPDNAEVAILEGSLYRTTAKFDEAQKALQDAIKADPKNLKAYWLLADIADQQRGPDADKVKAEMYGKILEIRPDNLAAQIELGRTLATSGDKAALATLIGKIAARAATFPEAARPIAASLAQKAQGANLRPVALGLVQIKNLLATDPNYKANLAEVSSLATGDPIPAMIKTPNPPSQPAPVDASLKYDVTPLPGAGATASFALAAPLNATDPPAVFSLEGGTVKRTDKPATLPFPVQTAAKTFLAPTIPLCALDYIGDFRGGLAMAGGSGLRLFPQKPDGSFGDATAAAKLPPAIVNAPYSGVWAADIEADGDLDIVLSSAIAGGVSVLQNNTNGTFTPLKTPFVGVASPLRAFAWADFDSDGDPDAAFVDASGNLMYFTNERSGRFERRQTPVLPGKAVALVAGVIDNSSQFSLLILLEDGSVVALTDKNSGTAWDGPKPLGKSGIAKPARLFLADMDNNGAVDLIVAGADTTDILLSDGPGKFAEKPVTAPISAQSIADLNADGLLDLAGIAGGKPVRALASASQNYKWQTVTLQAADHPREDSRINPFSIGGEVEIRSGLLYQKQPITTPQLHFGLGTYDHVDAARIIWPNGNPQGEFDLKIGNVVAQQRLGGSCPFLYTWDGQKMVFVTDCIWRSPLGLKINAQVTAGVTQTEDWVKIRGDQLVAQDGIYKLSITAELRETHFFDKVGLMAVDHPADTEIFVDERFSPTAPPLLAVIPTGAVHPVKQAWGTNGQDVTEIIRARDAKYLDDFGRGQYQGVTRDHWVEIDLSDAPKGKPLYLLAHGWVHPTDTSINVALGQNPSAAPPSGLRIETPDASGKWTTSRDALGFPEGKVKTVVLRVDDTFKPNAPRRLRLRTNLEVFWDSLAWAEAKPNAQIKKQTLTLADANLRYRGFSDVKSADKSSPELPESYDKLAGTGPQWRDLAGFYTRYGDIKPLLTTVDDHYVIMNAGDEMQFKFTEIPAPPSGWKRDYVLIGDGWVKDGNVNTEWGKTVMPYPAHDLKEYKTPPGRLEDDAVYRRHPDDWLNYHTRYVSPEAFAARLLPPLR